MAMPGVPAMISAINQAGGGVPIGSPSVSKSGAAPAIAAKIDESALDAIVTKVTQSIAAIPVMVSEVDITETQRRVEVIESKTIFG
jgi:predicted RNA methylase